MNSNAVESLEENCLRFNNMSAIEYHLFFIPYLYGEEQGLGLAMMGRLQEVNTSAFVCVDMIPQLREVQHRAYDRVMEEVEKRTGAAQTMGRDCPEEKEVECLTPLKKTLDLLQDYMASTTRKELMQKILDCVDSLSLHHAFVVGTPRASDV